MIPMEIHRKALKDRARQTMRQNVPPAWLVALLFWGLTTGELAVYSFLRRCEDRKTRQCWPSIKTIGKAVNMSGNTVRKYIRQLEERGIITAEPTEVITKAGGKRNGNLRFTLRPIQEVMDEYYARQMEDLELAAERQRVAKLLGERESPA